jgi:O-antigen ligase
LASKKRKMCMSKVNWEQIGLLGLSCGLIVLLLFSTGEFSQEILWGTALLIMAALCFAYSEPDDHTIFFYPFLALAIWIALVAVVFNLALMGMLPFLFLGLLLYIMGQRLALRPGYLKFFLLVLAGFTLIQLVLAGYQKIYWFNNLAEQIPQKNQIYWILSSGRVSGSFLNPNLLGAWLILILPALSGLAWTFSPKKRVIFIFFLVIGLIALVWTQSIGSWLALGVAVFISGLLLNNSKFKISRFLLSIGFICLIAVVVLVWLRGFSVGDFLSQHDAIYNRMILWQPAWLAFKDNWLFGYGPFLSEEIYRIWQQKSGVGFGTFPHQILLSLVLKGGLLLVVPVLILAGLILTRIIKNLKSEAVSPVYIGIFIGFIALIIHGFFEMQLDFIAFQSIFAIFTGFLIYPPVLHVNNSFNLALKVNPPRVSLYNRLYISKPSFLWKGAFVSLVVLLYQGGLNPWQTVVMVLGIGVGMWTHFSQGGAFKIRDRAEMFLWALLGILLFLNLFSINPGKSFNYTWVLVFAFAGWLILRRNPPTKISGFLWFYQLMASVSVVMVFLTGVFQSGFQNNLSHTWISEPVLAVRLWFPNQNLWAAGVLVPALFISLTALWKKKNITWHLTQIVILGWGLLYSGSHGAWVVFMAGTCWMFLRLKKPDISKNFFKKSVLITISVITLIFLWFGPKFANYKKEFKVSVIERIYIWNKSIQLASLKPFTGWGANTYSEAVFNSDLPALRPDYPRLSRYHTWPRNAHNLIIQHSVENGFIFTFLFITALGWLVLVWLKLKKPSPYQSALEAGVLALLLHSCFDLTMYTPFILFLAVLWLALRHPLDILKAKENLRPLMLTLCALVFIIGLNQALALRIGENLKKNKVATEQSFEKNKWFTVLALAPLSIDTRISLVDSVDSHLKTGFKTALLRFKLQNLQAAVRLAPEWGPARVNLARLYSQMASTLTSAELAQISVLIDEWEENFKSAFVQDWQLAYLRLAAVNSEKALQTRPYWAWWHFENAWYNWLSGNIEASSQKLDQALILEPMFALAWELKLKIAMFFLTVKKLKIFLKILFC